MEATAMDTTTKQASPKERKEFALKQLLHTISDAGSSLDNLATIARGCGEFDLAKKVLGYQAKLIDASKDVTEKLEALQDE